MYARVAGMGMWLALSAVLLIGVRSASATAKLEVVSETGTALSMKFTDASGSFVTLNFSRASGAGVWKSGVPATPGVVFGNANLEFASPSFLRSHDIPVQCSLMTFDSDFTALPVEDVTIFQLLDGDMAVGLWNYGKITHIGWVGEMIENFYLTVMDDDVPPPTTACNWLVSACCGTLNNPQTADPNDHLPPDISACETAAGGCSKTQKIQVCGCLASQCDDGNPQTNPGGPDNIEACKAQVRACQPTPPTEPDPIEELLEHILELLEELLQILTCMAMGGVWDPQAGECTFPDPPPAEEKCP
jgi:hypothetical protein